MRRISTLDWSRKSHGYDHPPERNLKDLNTELFVKTVGELSAEEAPGKEIHDRHQVEKPFLEGDLGDAEVEQMGITAELQLQARVGWRPMSAAITMATPRKGKRALHHASSAQPCDPGQAAATATAFRSDCQKLTWSSDTRRHRKTHQAAMTVLSEQILEAAARRPQGSLLAAKQFLALGKRDAVDQALRRLAVGGKLVKITRGRYALPVRSRFGARPPSPEVVIAQLNQEGAQQLVSSGAAAANALGLTTQMPVEQTFLARSRSQKRYVFGRQQVTIRLAAACYVLLADRPAGQRRSTTR